MSNFGERKTEKNRAGKEVKVWETPRFNESKVKAEEVIKQYTHITEADFWILKGESKDGETIMYNGLIISHNACLKINDELEDKLKFDPESVEIVENGYGDSLVFIYRNKKQGILETGEVSRNNCKQAYPYAMALKRCFDRVVLKNSKIAYGGIMSDAESDDFVQDAPNMEKEEINRNEKHDEKTAEQHKAEQPKEEKKLLGKERVDKRLAELDEMSREELQKTIDAVNVANISKLAKEVGVPLQRLVESYGKGGVLELNGAEYADAIDTLMEIKNKKQTEIKQEG